MDHIASLSSFQWQLILHINNTYTYRAQTRDNIKLSCILPFTTRISVLKSITWRKYEWNWHEMIRHSAGSYTAQQQRNQSAVLSVMMLFVFKPRMLLQIARGIHSPSLHQSASVPQWPTLPSSLDFSSQQFKTNKWSIENNNNGTFTLKQYSVHEEKHWMQTLNILLAMVDCFI